MKDTRTPVTTGILTVVLNVILCRLLMDSLGVEGLAIALSITTAAEAIIMMLFLKARSGRIFSDGFFGWLMRVIGAAALMGVVIGISRPWLNGVLESDTSFIVHLVYFGLCIGLYIATFTWAAWALRVPELVTVINRMAGMIPASIRARIPGM
jgi:putative peptidoglycan lipid II flippase